MARKRKPDPDDPKVWKGVYEDIDAMSREELLAWFRQSPYFDEAWVTDPGAREATPDRPGAGEEGTTAPEGGRQR